MRWTLLSGTSLLAAAALGAGCAPETTETLQVMVAIDEDATPASFEVAPSLGVGTVNLPVRLVNDVGMSVPGTTVTVSATGAELATSELRFDAFGYATASLSSDSSTRVQLSVLASGDGVPTGASGDGAIVSVNAPTYGMRRGSVLPDNGMARTHIASAHDGVAVAMGDEIWWAPYTTGRPGHRVADVQAEIEGLVSAHIDGDGVLDLLAWAGNTVWMLRGRSAGGYSWGATWRTLDGTIVGATPADLDADRLTDISVGITTETEGYVTVLFGDGAWGFEQSDTAELTFQVDSISSADEGFDGTADVTVINEAAGSLRRFTLSDDGWVGGQTPEISAYYALPGSELLPQADLNGDGLDELILVGPPGGAAQDFIFFTLQGVITQYPLAYGPFEPAVGELDLNPGAELLALEDNLLHVVWWSEERGRFISRNLTGVGDKGPLTVRDFDEDGIGDFAVAAGNVGFHIGAIDDELQFDLADSGVQSFGLGMLSTPLVADWSGDGQADLLGIVDNDGEISIGLWKATASADGLLGYTLTGIEGLTDGGDLHDMVECEGFVYVLIGTGDDSTIFRVTVSSGSDPVPEVGFDTAVSGTLLTCGQVPDSTVDGFVVASTSGAYTWYSRGFASKGSGELGSVSGIAIQEDAGGDPVVVGCSGAGCGIATVDLDGDGLQEVVRSEDQISVELPSGEQVLAGSGLLSIADVDGDGFDDVIATTSDAVLLYRALSNGLAPPIALSSAASLEGRAFLGDVDDDGIPELITRSDDGKVHVGGPTTASSASSW